MSATLPEHGTRHAPPEGGRPPIARRRVLAGAAGGTGALWVAPAMLSFSAAAAASALAGTVVGEVTHIQGNANKAVPLPAGTFTKYVLVVAEVTTGAGSGS